MMDPVLRVVVSCTDRKRLHEPLDLQLRAYDHPLPARAEAWLTRLEQPVTGQVPAASLYKGEHWAVADQIVDAGSAASQTVLLSIASAGYGLLARDELVEPYAATFATRQLDSVTRPGSTSDPSSDARFWWQRLGTRTRPPERPATVTALAEQHPDAPLIVALSGAYARAVADDLVHAAEVLNDRSQLFLVSAGSSEPRLEPFRVPVDARFLHTLGGTTLSLNVRVTKYLIERTQDHQWERDRVTRLLLADLARLPDRIRYTRDQLSDEQVKTFIEENLEAHPSPSRSALLRLLRDKNLACEQRRFGRLYEDVLEGAQP